MKRVVLTIIVPFLFSTTVSAGELPKKPLRLLRRIVSIATKLGRPCRVQNRFAHRRFHGW